jgi:phosphonate transport system permease protein
MTATLNATLTATAAYGRADRLIARRRLAALGLPAMLVAYLAYVFVAFDVAGLMAGARLDNAATLVADSYSHKVHVTRDNRSGEMSYAIEGENKGRWPEGETPAWVQAGAEAVVIDLGTGHVVRFLPGNRVSYDVPGFGLIEMAVVDGVVTSTLGPNPPDWINASDSRIAITTDAGRVTVTRNKSEVFRYFLGWEQFWFMLDSPYHDVGPLALAFGPQLDPERTNLAGAWQDFWGNKMWRHADVAWAIGETALMAFLGTFGAAIIALPLAFLAARNFTPLGSLRFAVRRVLDFVRGVDGLIWTIVLSRAFGPGPLTGALAIMVTDVGGFGKQFSEALENVDDRQIEGIASTGARPLQRYRFGVMPQVMPVLLSQVLYYLESNTRSATIVGAITGGGIGLLLTQAMQTQKDWEEVAYYIVLVLVMVFAMDSLSGWLRRRLIRGD